jgi:hypothetical protein
MPETIATAWFAVLFAMVAVWFVLISWLFRRLRDHHASTYEAMGSPSLFWNNSMRNNWLFMKFLFGSQWRELGDPAIANCLSFHARVPYRLPPPVPWPHLRHLLKCPFSTVSRGAPSNKRLQLTPNSLFQSIRGTVLAAGAVPQR